MHHNLPRRFLFYFFARAQLRSISEWTCLVPISLANELMHYHHHAFMSTLFVCAPQLTPLDWTLLITWAHLFTLTSVAAWHLSVAICTDLNLTFRFDCHFSKNNTFGSTATLGIWCLLPFWITYFPQWPRRVMENPKWHELSPLPSQNLLGRSSLFSLSGWTVAHVHAWCTCLMHCLHLALICANTNLADHYQSCTPVRPSAVMMRPTASTVSSFCWACMLSLDAVKLMIGASMYQHLSSLLLCDNPLSTHWSACFVTMSNKKVTHLLLHLHYDHLNVLLQGSWGLLRGKWHSSISTFN